MDSKYAGSLHKIVVTLKMEVQRCKVFIRFAGNLDIF
jgi:hypothetical protein